MEFKKFKTKLREEFSKKVKEVSNIYKTNVTKEDLWSTYLDSFSQEERQPHNCNCCKSFIRQFGGIVFFVDGELKTIWDFEAHGEYENVCKNMSALVKNSEIQDVFTSKTDFIGTDYNISTKGIKWEHLHVNIPQKFVNRSRYSNESLIATYRDNRNVFKRSCDEISMDAIDTVLELINQNSLYRGQEFKNIITEFKNIKKKYDLSQDKENFTWQFAINLPASISRMRNHSIGKLLTDITSGIELDKAVESFERMVAPTNYKRPTAVVTKSMLEAAEKELTELGLISSLNRRFATPIDITVNNVLFVNRNVKPTEGIFNKLKEDVIINPSKLSKVEEISANDFIEKVLPSCNNIEVLLENSHLNNFMTITTAEDSEAPLLFKWKNPFAWYYTNGITDALKERVKQAGGNIEAVLRFSLQWNEKGDSICDLDLHAYEPNGTEICFRSHKMVQTPLSGFLDVDMIRPSGVGIENITWVTKSKMKPGKYKMIVNNYDSGHNTGFTAQIEFNNEIYNFEYNKKLLGKIHIADVVYDGENFKLIPNIPLGSAATISNTKWGVDTNKYHKVSMVLNSPNHWDDNEVGNKHVFFIIEGCESDEPVRGFFNEFLTENMMKHKKVFETLGNKLKVPESKPQLSGIGFSTTQRNSVILKITGKFERILKVIF